MLRLKYVPLVLALALVPAFTAACQPEAATDDTAAVDAPDDGAETVAEPTAEMMDEAAAPADDMAAGDLGTIEIAAGDPIRLAALLVLSGPNESLGVDSRDGVEIAIDDYGPIAGHAVELLAEDSQCSPEGGQTAATKVAADPTIAGVIGTSCSSAAEAAIPVITEAGLTMVSASNTAPSLTAADRPAQYAGYLRTAHNDLFQGRVAAEYAFNELGATTAATIHDGSAYAEQLASVFAQVFTELGGEITAQEAVNVGDTDMGPVLTSIAATSPAVLYYPIFTSEGGFVTAQARETEGLADTALMGADGMFSKEFVEAAGDAAEGVYLSGPYVASGDAYNAFLAKVEAKYGRGTLSGFHAHAYDAATMLLNGIKAAAVENADGSLTIDKRVLRDAVFATTDFAGLTGTLTCQGDGDANPGDCATGEALAVFQIKAENLGADGVWPPEVVFQP
ncbi:MAG: branched-chain amino acid ABC transporter substrate-binding protein [Caldilineae bacterium]|nr:branched-chain amino acid ABC transporter substrate-binding protein [Chloroflexota bacterium]MCB9176658.1 branched-chain amino acid ABC transporter substrate-binding protein [Caldilineae bacterium]